MDRQRAHRILDALLDDEYLAGRDLSLRIEVERSKHDSQGERCVVMVDGQKLDLMGLQAVTLVAGDQSIEVTVDERGWVVLS
jgi:hypothetical protein